ncbi:MAG: PAS-domain containing protein, partial [Bauldia sp.]
MRKHDRAFAIGFAGLTAAFSPTLFSSPANAAAPAEIALFGYSIHADHVVGLAALIGTIGFAVLSAIALMRARNRAEIENRSLRLEIAGLKAAADRAEAMVNREDQRTVVWGPAGEAPLVAGTLPSRSGVPSDRSAFLAFGTWLQPESAGRIDRAVARLRERGEAFTLVLATNADRLVEALGRTVGASAVVRFRDLSGDRLARAEVEARFDLLTAEVDAMRAMLSSAPMPIWLRDGDGRLVWVNAAYTAAVEARTEADAVERGLELLDQNGRRLIFDTRAKGPVFTGRLPAIVAGNRRVFEVSDIVSPSGSAGIACDMTAIEAAEAALRREIDFNARTLDQLATAVAIFGPDQRLRSYNAAYRDLFDLDPTFLATRPDESGVLDRLRVARKLPEQADFRSWRADIIAAYRAIEAHEYWWHLPDGQTLRVIANPNPQGGVTWVYENVTERLDLESRYNSLIHVQGETLDHLAEGVAVFGSDGRLRLHNPAFAAIWRLPPGLLEEEPHVATIVTACRRPDDDDSVWTRFTAAVAGLDESRSRIANRIDRADGRVIDYATVPLPDGQTMVTFVDATDSVKVERALVERAEALEAADSLKNAFIQHVSYELRSPLTNIIGFAQLLGDSGVGPLNTKQRDYTGYILTSSAALLAIVNDILDLATVDAGIMELDLADTDIAETVEAVIEGVQDRVHEAHIVLDTHIPDDIGSLVADGKRLRQILYNLLSNAVAFSSDGGSVSVSATRDRDTVEFRVTDEGPGIPNDYVDTA